MVYMLAGVKYPAQGVNVKCFVDSIFYHVNNVYTTLIQNSVKVKVGGSIGCQFNLLVKLVSAGFRRMRHCCIL